MGEVGSGSVEGRAEVCGRTKILVFVGVSTVSMGVIAMGGGGSGQGRNSCVVDNTVVVVIVVVHDNIQVVDN